MSVFPDSHRRDIKLDNIFVVPGPRVNGQPNFVVKIIDFGIGELMRPGHRLSLQCGTPAYVPTPNMCTVLVY
jgi:serine/threonine protein kinase